MIRAPDGRLPPSLIGELEAPEAALAVASEAIARLTAASRPNHERRTALVNVKVGVALADALAEHAAQDGITQKQLICRALAAYGLPADPLDLEDRTPRRQRAA
jgi:hypothetical protein